MQFKFPSDAPETSTGTSTAFLFIVLFTLLNGRDRRWPVSFCHHRFQLPRKNFPNPPFPQIAGGEADLPEEKMRGEPHPEAAAPLTIPWAVLKQSGSGIRSRRRFNFSFLLKTLDRFHAALECGRR